MKIKSTLKIVDTILTKDPTLGEAKGWAKNGTWLFRKMMSQPEKELQAFLNGIIDREMEKFQFRATNNYRR